MNSLAEPSGKELFFDEDEIIVSKTDIKGRITYANAVFMRLAGYTEGELLGQPHSLIRHQGMPRCVFKLLWDTLQAGNEIFAYVVNKAKNGDYYWVFAHVTPTFDDAGNIISYHSSRRVPKRTVLDETIIPLYQMLLEIEDGHSNRKDGMMAAHAELLKILKDKGIGYDEFIFSL